MPKWLKILIGSNYSLWAIFLAAILMRFSVVNSWWCLDDWGQLAQAAGAIDRLEPIPARWLSQDLYWRLVHSLFSINPVPYAVSRILLHAIAAVTVARIAKNSGLNSMGKLLSGLIFAASPIAFTCLYWASGIQELLAGVFALLAVERWFAKDRTNIILPMLCAVCSILSKESGLALPILFLGSEIWNNRNKGQINPINLGSILVLFLVAGWESFLILQHFATGDGAPYSLGGFLVIIGNLGKIGWWLLSQGPIFTAQVTWTLAGIGLGFFGLWFLWAILTFKQKGKLPLVLFAAAVLSLAPALALVNQVRPYMGYLAMACISLALGSLWPDKWVPKVRKLRLLVTSILLFISVFWGTQSMNHRVTKQDDEGRPNDPVVRAMALSKVSFQDISRKLVQNSGADSYALVIFQQPLRAEDILRAQGLGHKSVVKSPVHPALDGETGLSLLTGKKKNVFWVNSLLKVPAESFVFCETKNGFEYWGRTRDALLNATLIDVLVGNYDRAERQLHQAGIIDDQFDSYQYGSELLKLPMSIIRSHGAIFMEKLMPAGKSPSLVETKNMKTDYELFLVLLGNLSKTPN